MIAAYSPSLICRSPETLAALRGALLVSWSRAALPSGEAKEAAPPDVTLPSFYDLSDWLATDKHKMEESNPGYFRVSRYLDFLRTKSLGQAIMYAPELPSTQLLLKEKCAGISSGLVCVADQQMSGRGRGTNTWSSPLGCLMFSCKTALASGATLPFVQYLISIAIIRAIKNTPKFEHAPVNIKWPNDIYANGKNKIGGVLCQSIYADERFDVTIGVGLNVNNKEPTTCVNALVAEGAISREYLLAEIMSEFEPMLHQFAIEGFAPFREEYVSMWLHSGQKVLIEEEGGASSPAWIAGLTEDGYLLGKDEAGHSVELFPDGNSFDFFKGLIRMKR